MDPRAEYERRLADRRARIATLETRSKRIADLRLACFLATLVVAYFAIAPRAFTPWLIALPAAAFVVLVVVHDRALAAQRRAERAAAFYARGLARIDDRWSNDGDDGARFLQPDHPYAADLDLFGPGSLFQLLSLARTAAGESTLARWLCETAGVAEVRARQGAVAGLRERVDIREDVAVLGADVRAAIDPDRLEAWGRAEVDAFPAWARPAAAVLSAARLVALYGWWQLGWGPIPAVVAVALGYALRRPLHRAIERAVDQVSRAGRDLALLAELLARIERERFDDPRLAELSRTLTAGGVPASARIAELERRVSLYEARFNQFFVPIAYLLHWEIHLAGAIAAWRRVCGPQLGAWVRAVGELEALSSLAGYAFEHPADPFPELVEQGPHYAAEALGHPLIPANACVRNDLELTGARRLVLVSGSNMSGKSTYLRTIGVNAVLALMGAPVRARRMAIAPLLLGATLRVQDSLQQGASRFYAEITRLKQVLDLAGRERPLLFLLDEILHGTNSHDRLIGAEALIRALVDRGAFGLVTTHDLALARVVDTLGPRAENAHFADVITDGKLGFDYRRRPGVVQQSNAIALMRAVGLPL